MDPIGANLVIEELFSFFVLIEALMSSPPYPFKILFRRWWKIIMRKK
jgi:hypothetical protein